MSEQLIYWAAALYLAASVSAAAGAAQASPTLRRLGVSLLTVAVCLHGFSFAVLHRDGPPPLTDLAAAVSLTAWLGSAAFLFALLLWPRLAGLVVLVAPLAFLGVVFGFLPVDASVPLPVLAGRWSHLHVLLSSAGLALLGLAGGAGALLLIEDRWLKAKRPLGSARLPSLESLDRAGAVAMAVGFPLLTLGFITGVLWLRGATGEWWTGAPHQVWSALAWFIYVGLSSARFFAHQGAHAAARSAALGFSFLIFAVVGVEVLW